MVCLGHNYAGIIAGITLAVESPYTIELRAVDKLGESGGTLSFAVSTAEATVDLGEGGNSVGVGRLAHVGTEKRVDVAWNAYFEKNVFVGGKTLVDLIYPVGSVYISFNNRADPSMLFGGTWERIRNRFLWAATENGVMGETGGEESHRLTVSEMPSHNGHLSAGIDGHVPIGKGNYEGYLNKNVSNPYPGGGYRGWNVYAGNEMHPASEAVGGGKPHNNMPPFIQVAMWKRIA